METLDNGAARGRRTQIGVIDDVCDLTLRDTLTGEVVLHADKAKISFESAAETTSPFGSAETRAFGHVPTFNGMKLIAVDHLFENYVWVPVKRHKQKRLQKKYAKLYGYKGVKVISNEIIVTGDSMIMHSTTIDRLMVDINAGLDIALHKVED